VRTRTFIWLLYLVPQSHVSFKVCYGHSGYLWLYVVIYLVLTWCWHLQTSVFVIFCILAVWGFFRIKSMYFYAFYLVVLIIVCRPNFLFFLVLNRVPDCFPLGFIPLVFFSMLFFNRQIVFIWTWYTFLWTFASFKYLINVGLIFSIFVPFNDSMNFVLEFFRCIWHNIVANNWLRILFPWHTNEVIYT
jgi:hypothetical protein